MVCLSIPLSGELHISVLPSDGYPYERGSSKLIYSTPDGAWQHLYKASLSCPYFFIQYAYESCAVLGWLSYLRRHSAWKSYDRLWLELLKSFLLSVAWSNRSFILYPCSGLPRPQWSTLHLFMLKSICQSFFPLTEVVDIALQHSYIIIWIDGSI